MLYLCLLFAIVLLAWLPNNRPLYGEYEADVLDVAQGLSVLIKTNNHTLLYDFGASSLSGFNYYQSVILPQLLQQRMHHLHAIVISHNDNDHVGGFPYFQSDESRVIAPRKQTIFMPTLNLADNLPMMEFHDWQIKKACEGQSWIWDGVTFEFVNTHSKRLSRTQNNRSCVLKVSSDYGSILIPGDIEWPVELLLSKRDSAWLKSDVLIAPHHGSTTSSSEIFVEKVRPSYVIYSTAMFNRYGHPHEEVRRRYQAHSSKEYNTACDGKVAIRFATQGIKITSAKKQSAKVWHQPCPAALFNE